VKTAKVIKAEQDIDNWQCAGISVHETLTGEYIADLLSNT